MNLHSFTDGVVLGLLAMAGVFLVLAIIGLVLYAFRLIFYRKGNQPVESHKEVPERIIAEKGISKTVVAAIAAAIYQCRDRNYYDGGLRIKIKRHKKINKTYEKLKLERWKNG